MEAGTAGAPDQRAQLDQALNNLESSINELKTRVNGDLESLKGEIQTLNSQTDAVDLTAIISRVESIQTTVVEIDAREVVQTGAPDQPTAPEGAQPGDQGQPATDAPASPDAPADPNTATPGADAPDDSPEPTPATGEPGVDTPQDASPVAPEASRTVYTFDGDESQIDTASWPRAETLQTEDGRPLYYYAGDTELGQANGAQFTDQGWNVYTGPVHAA